MKVSFSNFLLQFVVGLLVGLLICGSLLISIVTTTTVMGNGEQLPQATEQKIKE